VSVCLFVCSSARIPQQLHVQIPSNFLYILSVVMARSSCDGCVVRYVLPVLLMTSRFSHNGGPMGQNQKRRRVSFSLPGGGTGAKCAVLDCMHLVTWLPSDVMNE